jgi:hypothetical protein
MIYDADGDSDLDKLATDNLAAIPDEYGQAGADGAESRKSEKRHGAGAQL